ncbi:hypothetical protein KKG71_01215 [Patescibacteria group bacterium]|nr:hypothetical protein [Patescibacteria group bacterium]
MQDTGDLTRKNIRESIKKTKKIIWELDNFQKTEAEKRKWKQDDIRISTHSKFIAKLCSLLINLNTLQYYFDHDNSFAEVFGIPWEDYSKALHDLFATYFKTVRFDFTVGIFSIFEDGIALALEKNLSKEEYSKLFFDPSIILTDPEIKKLIKEKFPKKFNELKKKEGFIPFQRKIDRLKKKNYLNKKETEFCDFFRCMRNVTHSNGFYNGKNRTFDNILGQKFEFIDKKPVMPITLKLTIDWANELIEVFKLISSRMEIEFIPDNAFIPNDKYN